MDNKEPKKNNSSKIIIIIVSVVVGLILLSYLSFILIFGMLAKGAGKVFGNVINSNVVREIIDETKDIKNEIKEEFHNDDDHEGIAYKDKYIEITSTLNSDYVQTLTINNNEKIITEGADSKEFEVEKINEHYLVVTECEMCQVTTENGYVINQEGHIIAKLLPNEITLPEDSYKLDGMLVSREVEVQNNFIVLETKASTMAVYTNGDLIGTEYYFTVKDDTLVLDHYENRYYQKN